ncbi:MAG: FtsX-like permease family protein [Luteitalea sp.]|nr:FtsX-like permease family protein [Luteitalea sp.]
MRPLRPFEDLLQDLRYGARLLRRSPVFAAVAILSLALGTGANTAIFQLVDAVRLRTLPVQDPQELVEIRIADARARTGNFNNRHSNLTNPLWERIRAEQQAFSGALAWSDVTFDLTAGGERRPAEGLWVSGDFFNTLGVEPLIGRLFTPADDRRGCTPPLAVVSHAFWQRELGGDPSAPGRTLLLDGQPFEIIGVTPAGFFGVEVGRAFDVAVPICTEPVVRGGQTALDTRTQWFLAAMGRLKPGWTIERASAHLGALSAGVFEATVSPSYNAQDRKNYLAFKLGTFPSSTGLSRLRGDYEAPLWILLGVTGLVLLIACANLANLMLARATAREREIAVRLAIGASRTRIVRQMLSESLLIAAIGTGIGLLLAQGISRLLVGFLSTERSPRFVDLTLDWRVFTFTIALAVGACLLFGLVPAIGATRSSPASAMKAGGRGMTDVRERFGMRRGLVVLQVALSLVLLVGALLFVRSLRNLLTLDPGFRQDSLLIASLDLRRAGVAEESRLIVYEEITNRLRALPGVAAAARTFIVPVSGASWRQRIFIGGRPQPSASNFNLVGTGYFAAMGTPIRVGRDFDRRDTPTSPRVAIVNESFVREYVQGANPLGQTFQNEGPPGERWPFYQIIGVVKNTKYRDLREPLAPLAFLAASQDENPGPSLQLVIQPAVALAAVTSAVTREIGNIDSSISVQFDTMTAQIQRSLLRERLMAFLSGFFGALAAAVATIGLYGVMSYTVARRRTEIGIRMALGADRGAVVWMIVREAGILVLVGLITGVLLTMIAARTATALLFELQPWDPLTLTLAMLTLGTVGMLASWLPAYRASHLEPTLALREE